MTALKDLLTDEERAAIRAPIDEARTFPARAFMDTDYFQFEITHALKESWLAVAFSEEISNAGDIMVLNPIGHPLLLVRGEDGIARAFHNVCPYDGCEVCIRSQHGVDQITTPYHGWTYGLSGDLLKAGYWDGTPEASGLDLRSLNADLVQVPCEEWLNTLFVFLGEHHVPFNEQYRPILDHFAGVDLDRLEVGREEKRAPMISSLPIEANWKTVYENYSPNVYHESFVHAMYRKSPHSPRVDSEGNKTYTEINDPSGFLGLHYDNSIGASFYGESGLPPVLNKDGSPNRINTIANAYPNWVITVLGNAARIALFLPSGPEEGQQRLMTLFDRDGATDPALAEDRKASMRAGLQARKEDNYICESVQRARHSPGVTSQFYSPFWDAMHYTMTNQILTRLEASEHGSAP